MELSTSPVHPSTETDYESEEDDLDRVRELYRQQKSKLALQKLKESMKEGEMPLCFYSEICN
jgi:hypothetical protein